MKRIVLFSLFIMKCCILMAQQDYYVFLQSENKKPYYVRVHDKKYEAASNGLLTIPGFSDSSCVLRIGFPAHPGSEYPFRIQFHDKDLGLQLKQTSGGVWALYDWQNKEWIYAQKQTEAVPDRDSAIVSTVRREDEFAELMAAVVNDSSMLYTTIEHKIAPKDSLPQVTVIAEKPQVGSRINQPDSASAKSQPVHGKGPDSAIVTSATHANAQKVSLNKDSLVMARKNLPPKATGKITAPSKSNDSLELLARKKTSVPDKKTVDSAEGHAALRISTSVKKLLDNNLSTGKLQIYIVTDSAGNQDTVHIMIPMAELTESAGVLVKVDTAKKKPVVESDPVTTRQQGATDSATATVMAKTITDSISVPPPVAIKAKTDSLPLNEKKDSVEVKKLKMINSDCRNFASEQDVDKLRVRMLEVNTEDDRILVARKLFRIKCVSTKQVKALSELFMNDEGRYRFFDAAYPFVSDSDNFRQLVELLSDPYFINRFKAMVRM